ncbi:MAG: hypothetical protein WKF57_13155 [Nakamurella sp.]
MTLLSELTDRLELNPDATYPPFPVYLAVPTTWTLLDTNPATWQRSAERMVDETFHGSRVTGKERRQIIGFFGQLVEQCQQAGSALSILQVGRLREGVAASLGVHIAFVDEQTESTVGRIRDSLPRTGTVVELDSGVGPALQRSERTTFMPPGSGELVSMTSIQIFAPIQGTSWTVVLATASAHPELTEPVTLLLQNMAVSLRLTEDPDDDTDDDTETEVAEQFEQAPSVRGPGIERGFSTLVRKKIGPDTAEPGAADRDTTDAGDSPDGDPTDDPAGRTAP